MRGRDGDKHQCERETSIGWLLHMPWPGTKLQSRHVPSLGIKPTTFGFTGSYSNQLNHTSQGFVIFFFYFKLLSKPTLSDHFDFSWRRMPTCILNTSTLSFLTCKDINNINCVNLLLNKTQSQKLKFHWLLA